MIKNKEIEVDFLYQSITYNKDTNLLIAQRNQNYGVIDLEGNVIVPIQYKSVRFNGTYIYAKGELEEVYYKSNGEKAEDTYTGMKEIEGEDIYITTNQDKKYGLLDKERKSCCRK